MIPAGAKPTVALVLGLLLVVAGALLVPAVLNRESLRAEIEAEISAALGHPATIERIALLRLLPSPRARLEGIRINHSGIARVVRLPELGADADQRDALVQAGSGLDSLATIDAVELHAALWPLLSGQLRLTEVSIERPVLRLSSTQRQPPSQAPLQPQASGQASDREPARMPIPGRPLSQQGLRPEDQGGATPAAASALGPGGRGALDQPVATADPYSATGASKPLADAGWTSSPGAAEQGASVEELGVGAQKTAGLAATEQAQEQERAVPRAGSVAPDAATLSTADLPPIERLSVRDGVLIQSLRGTDETLQVKALALTAGPLASGQDGRIEGRFRLAAARWPAAVFGTFAAELSLPAPPSRVLLQPLRVHLASAPALRAPPIDATATVTLALASGRVLIDDLRLSAGALEVLGNAKLTSAPEGAALVGRFRVPFFDLRAWLSEAFGLALPGDDGTWRQTALAFALHQRGSTLALDALELSVDAMRAHAWARLDLAAIPGALPTGRVAVSLDRLALDPYLPAFAAPAGASDAAAGSAAAAAPASLPPIGAVPKRPDALVLRLGAHLIEIGGLRYRAVSLDASADQRALALEGTADLYSGALQASLRAPGPGASASALQLDASAQGVDLGALLADLRQVSGAPAPVSGTAGIVLSLQAPVGSLAALEPDALREMLGGEVSLAVRDGRLTLVDLRQLLMGSLGALGASREDLEQLTQFRALSLSATGARGRFRSDDIQLRSPFLEVDGGGVLELPREQLALDLTALLVNPPQGRGLKELEGIPIPIRARGDWADPRWEVDAEQVLRQAARRSLQEDSGLFDQLEERTGIEGLGDGLRQILPGLLGQ